MNAFEEFSFTFKSTKNESTRRVQLEVEHQNFDLFPT